MAKVIAKNKIVFFNYELLDKYESGIVLQGWEIKSIRLGNVSLKNAYVTFKKNEAYVLNMHISHYMNSYILNSETQVRKLLLHKKQLSKLEEKAKTKGLAIVPIVLKINSRGKVKIDIALARGKNKVDKRQVIKERDLKRRRKQNFNLGM